jgi:tRNA nucleotidyltransferase (CCA-adding enzyme)
MVNTIEEDLAGRDFTINAIADGQTNIVDAFKGRDDMRNKIIKTVDDADLSFKAEPMRMLRAIRLAAELDFDLEKNLYDAIINNGHLLDGAKISKIRDEFAALLTGINAGKGLRLLIETGLISVILTRDIVNKLTKREWRDLAALAENIDKTQPVEARRLGLFFTCIDKRKSRPAIERLDFDEKTKRHLLDAVQDMPKLYFISTKPVLKKFIYERGWERYEYLANMEKAQRIVFEYFSEHKIEIKMFLLDEIKRFREPIFPDELKIDANDLIEAGICTRENAEKILGQITEEVHTHPKKNTREELMKLAKIYSKNKIRAVLRGIHWER